MAASEFGKSSGRTDAEILAADSGADPMQALAAVPGWLDHDDAAAIADSIGAGGASGLAKLVAGKGRALLVSTLATDPTPALCAPNVLRWGPDLRAYAASLAAALAPRGGKRWFVIASADAAASAMAARRGTGDPRRRRHPDRQRRGRAGLAQLHARSAGGLEEGRAGDRAGIGRPRPCRRGAARRPPSASPRVPPSRRRSRTLPISRRSGSTSRRALSCRRASTGIRTTAPAPSAGGLPSRRTAARRPQTRPRFMNSWPLISPRQRRPRASMRARCSRRCGRIIDRERAVRPAHAACRRHGAATGRGVPRQAPRTVAAALGRLCASRHHPGRAGVRALGVPRAVVGTLRHPRRDGGGA